MSGPSAVLVAIALMLAVTPAPAAPGPAASQNDTSIIAVFRLNGPLNEVPVGDEFPLFGPPGTSLKELVERLDKAAVDPAVKAVVILPEQMAAGAPQLEEVRAAMARIRSGGKEVYVHADALMMGPYLMACGASRISVVPTGPVLIPGLLGSTLHVRGLLDKIGVKPDLLTAGEYKSAAELFMREQPSPEADEMMNWLMDSLYSSVHDLIASGRKAEADAVRDWLDNGLFTAEQARDAGLIDAVQQHEEFRALLEERYGADVVFDGKYGRKSQPEVDFSSPFAMFKIWGELLRGPQKSAGAKPAVGIVYVDGPIMVGKREPNPFGGGGGAFSADVREALEKAAEDDSIRAVVLRVNSPGGSVTASEIILNATRGVKARKPFVVSMGNVAGSGGYYVACAADTIFADATTLTGSIGVVGGKLATTEMWRKIGITFKEYKRGRNAGIFSTDDIFTESERERVRLLMDDAYAGFKDRVMDIRGDRLKKPIEEVAGGRVYTGRQALELGLIDRLGTMSDAVAFAAAAAAIDDYDVRVVPEPKTFIEELMEQLSGEDDETGRIGVAAGDDALVRLAAPYLENLDPRRTAAVASALRRLQILQQEGMAASMPEILAE